jgi:hypothetical protein
MRGPRHISIECKEKRHKSCDGYVMRKEWYEQVKPCTYICHKTNHIKE